ncbi:unnamed protein product [Phytophthora fragariaefolia]|uniref:Unnamed protein product n=1 Tax=Phytophthora fragariaefolia TaxID=1490495 RepID=A0A9W6XKS5_9STRA|nr:unnamed protein product [Phytophthora fragariaefolia]
MPPDGNLNWTEGVDYFVGTFAISVCGAITVADMVLPRRNESSSVCRRQGWLAFAPDPNVAAPLPAPAPPAVAAPPDTSVSAQELTAGVAAERSYYGSAQREPDGPGFRVPDETDDDLLVATQQRPEDRIARNPRVVTLDDFDSDDFIMALRRDRLFDPVDAGDLDVGREDWLLELDSEAEGDEDTILADKDAEDESDEESMAPLIDNELDDPVDFDLKKPELDRLQLEEWEVYDKHQSEDLHVDAAPLYAGPIGPTKAALACADSPLALFFFFLPKELWRRIAEETNTYSLSCVDEIAVVMRTRALDRKKTVPSTSVLTVEEYKHHQAAIGDRAFNIRPVINKSLFRSNYT